MFFSGVSSELLYLPKSVSNVWAVLSPVLGIVTSCVNLYLRFVQKKVSLENIEKQQQQA
jgi:hypothetical protein